MSNEVPRDEPARDSGEDSEAHRDREEGAAPTREGPGQSQRLPAKRFSLLDPVYHRSVPDTFRSARIDASRWGCGGMGA